MNKLMLRIGILILGSYVVSWCVILPLALYHIVLGRGNEEAPRWAMVWINANVTLILTWAAITLIVNRKRVWGLVAELWKDGI